MQSVTEKNAIGCELLSGVITFLSIYATFVKVLYNIIEPAP